MFLLGARENIYTAIFLDAQELHFWSTLKANVYTFLYISARKFLFQRRSNIFLLKFLSKTKTYKLVVGNCGSSIYC